MRDIIHGALGIECIEKLIRTAANHWLMAGDLPGPEKLGKRFAQTIVLGIRAKHVQRVKRMRLPKQLSRLGLEHRRELGKRALDRETFGIIDDSQYVFISADEPKIKKRAVGDRFFVAHAVENRVGIFDIRAADGRWMRVAVEAGDLIVVPADLYHRFFLTERQQIRCVRLFKDAAGWVPEYRVTPAPAAMA